MTLVLFLGMWLAAHRLSRLVLDDSILERPREALFRKFPPTAEMALAWRGDATKTSKLGELFYCYWCFGFWAAGVVVLAVDLFSSVPLPLLWWPAISSAVALTARNLDGE